MSSIARKPRPRGTVARYRDLAAARGACTRRFVAEYAAAKAAWREVCARRDHAAERAASAHMNEVDRAWDRDHKFLCSATKDAWHRLPALLRLLHPERCPRCDRPRFATWTENGVPR